MKGLLTVQNKRSCCTLMRLSPHNFCVTHLASAPRPFAFSLKLLMTRLSWQFTWAKVLTTCKRRNIREWCFQTNDLQMTFKAVLGQKRRWSQVRSHINSDKFTWIKVQQLQQNSKLAFCVDTKASLRTDRTKAKVIFATMCQDFRARQRRVNKSRTKEITAWARTSSELSSRFLKKSQT